MSEINDRCLGRVLILLKIFPSIYAKTDVGTNVASTFIFSYLTFLEESLLLSSTRLCLICNAIPWRAEEWRRS